MFDPKQPGPGGNAPNPSSTVSYGAGNMPVPAGQRPAAQPPPPPANTVAKGPLSPRTVELVQRSWAQVAPISDAAATLFYDRLFEMDPSVRALFKNDLAQQKKKLMQTLSVAVDGLSNPQKLVPVLEQLGVRHAGYMVQEHHYGLVGEALLWTLREGLGDSFNPETETAWKEVYTLVATVMKKAAASGKTSPPVPPAAPTERPGPPVPTASRPPPQASAPPVSQASAPPVPHAAPPPVAAPSAPASQRPSMQTPTVQLGGSAQPPTAQPAAQPAAKGPLSPHTVELVQRSWAQVAPISDAAATLFYDRLFELDPSVQVLFKSDLAQQKKKLMQMLNVAVDGLSTPQRLIPVLEQLGARHAGYMVQEHHYGLVGEALLWTLREGLGESFTPETEAAWKEVYGLVATVMKKASGSAAASRPPASPPAPPPPAPPVPDEVSMGMPMPTMVRQGGGDETMPYHLLAQTRVMGMQPFAQPYSPQEMLSGNGVPHGAPAPAPASASISIPLNVPKEVTLNVHLNLKIEADSALKALGQLRAPAPQPPAPAPAPSAPPRGSVSPVLLVALCVLVSVSTVVALGPLGQAASAFTLADLARLAAPVFTLAALAIGYLWGRGRGPESKR